MGESPLEEHQQRLGLDRRVLEAPHYELQLTDNTNDTGSPHMGAVLFGTHPSGAQPVANAV